MAFAVVSLRGCDAMLKEFETSGSADKMNPTRIIFCLTEDEIDQSLAKIQDDTEREAMRLLVQLVTFNAEAIKEAYDNEETVLRVYPDESFINKALQAIGAEHSYVLDENEVPSGHFELVAFAKRSLNGRRHTFTFRSPHLSAVTIRDSEGDSDKVSRRTNRNTEISGDKVIVYNDSGDIISIEDVTPLKADILGNDNQTKEKFSIVRWRDFYEWCASLTDLAEEWEVEASSIEAKAALDGEDLTKVASSQTVGEPVYIDRDYDPWDYVDGDKVRWKRKSPISFAVYACHSYRQKQEQYRRTIRTGQRFSLLPTGQVYKQGEKICS